MEQHSWGLTNSIGVSSSALLRPIRSLTFPTCFICDYDITNPHRPEPQGNTYSAFIEPLQTEFDRLQEIIIISGRQDQKSQRSGFDNSIEVQYLKNCLTHAFEAEMERNLSFQIPEVAIYTEPFLPPMFRDEMEQANHFRVYENYDLKETVDWFDSEC